jgi:hypothetical protein
MPISRSAQNCRTVSSRSSDTPSGGSLCQRRATADHRRQGPSPQSRDARVPPTRRRTPRAPTRERLQHRMMAFHGTAPLDRTQEVGGSSPPSSIVTEPLLARGFVVVGVGLNRRLSAPFQALLPLFAQMPVACRGLPPIRLDSGPGQSQRWLRLKAVPTVRSPPGARYRGLGPRYAEHSRAPSDAKALSQTPGHGAQGPPSGYTGDYYFSTLWSTKLLG